MRDPLRLLSGAEGVITGTIVAGSVIAAGTSLTGSHARLSGAIVVSVLVYYLAHTHAEILGASVAERHHPARALRGAMGHSWTIVAVSLVGVGILFGTAALDWSLRDSAELALFVMTALLALYSFLAGRRGGMGLVGSVAAALVGAGLGLVLIVLKALLKH